MSAGARKGDFCAFGGVVGGGAIFRIVLPPPRLSMPPSSAETKWQAEDGAEIVYNPPQRVAFPSRRGGVFL